MLDPHLPIAIYAEAYMGDPHAKMAEGILRYGRNPIVAVIDSHAAGKRVRDMTRIDSDVPIVTTLDDAIDLGAQVLVTGTAPSGGRIPPEWIAIFQAAIDAGLHLVNGLHDRMNDLFGASLKPGQWIWDIRTPIGDMPRIAMGRARTLTNRRVLMVGTDMAVGKMTAGLELLKALTAAGRDAKFLATGQIGMTVTGDGIPLDAFRVDHAAGAVERMVMNAADREIVIIEGQGSLLHPGSTATLPLMRGSACTDMILCHMSGMDQLHAVSDAPPVTVPPLSQVVALNEAVASAAGALMPAKVRGIAVNTSVLDNAAARAELAAIEAETGLPTTDPVRYGADKLAKAVTNA